VRTVRMLTFETTFLAMSELGLDIGTGSEPFPGGGDPIEMLEQIAAAKDIRLDPPLNPLSESPYQWQIGDTTVPLGTLLSQTVEPTRIIAQFAEPLPSIRPA